MFDKIIHTAIQKLRYKICTYLKLNAQFCAIQRGKHKGRVKMSIVNGESICQVAIIVKDVEETARQYAELFGVPVPEVIQVPPEEIAHTKYRGAPTFTRAKIAVFRLGQVALELTQPDLEPSSWKEFLDKKGEGVHHISFMTSDRDKVVDYFEKNDMPVRHYGEYPGGNYTIFDSFDKFKVLIQVKYKPDSK
jgi:methylmalonyl-CoA/ethylmalonyl-CoA epimerase